MWKELIFNTTLKYVYNKMINYYGFKVVKWNRGLLILFILFFVLLKYY